MQAVHLYKDSIKDDIIFLSRLKKQTNSERNILNKWFQDSIKNYFLETYASPFLKNELGEGVAKKVKANIEKKILQKSGLKFMNLLNQYKIELFLHGKSKQFVNSLIFIIIDDQKFEKGSTLWSKQIKKKFVSLMLIVLIEHNEGKLTSFYDTWNSIFPTATQIKRKLTKDDKFKLRTTGSFLNLYQHPHQTKPEECHIKSQSPILQSFSKPPQEVINNQTPKELINSSLQDTTFSSTKKCDYQEIDQMYMMNSHFLKQQSIDLNSIVPNYISSQSPSPQQQCVVPSQNICQSRIIIKNHIQKSNQNGNGQLLTNPKEIFVQMGQVIPSYRNEINDQVEIFHLDEFQNFFSEEDLMNRKEDPQVATPQISFPLLQQQFFQQKSESHFPFSDSYSQKQQQMQQQQQKEQQQQYQQQQQQQQQQLQQQQQQKLLQQQQQQQQEQLLMQKQQQEQQQQISSNHTFNMIHQPQNFISESSHNQQEYFQSQKFQHYPYDSSHLYQFVENQTLWKSHQQIDNYGDKKEQLRRQQYPQIIETDPHPSLLFY